jgi:hypothetical protein
MNTFHWHVVDSQSFPLDVPDFPELAAKGAYSSSETYSAVDVQDIVSYAGAVRPSFTSTHSQLTFHRSARNRRADGVFTLLPHPFHLISPPGNRHSRPLRHHLYLPPRAYSLRLL